ncbi:MAG: cytochrome c oxidase subunit II, partial [Bdellovibrionales bacterium]|nr:cytochrome c oxidase subunit II [Bdellovibrionales bacterium]
MFDFMPEQASTIAPKIDWLNHLVTVISVFFTVVIVGAMIYFAVRYRKRGGQDHETPRIEGNGFLEVVWTTVPTLICILIGYYGVAFYREMRAEESNPVEINVWGQKWRWDFEYPNGKKTNAELVVPVGRQVKLITRSRDVIHSFFIPAMRVKRDVLPTEYGSLYFTPIKTGDYNVFCTEYCGQDHWDMLAKLRVVSQAEYDRWLQDRSAELEMSRMSPVELGKQLYNEKGCLACHSLDGSPRVGPSFLKLYGREGEFADGATYKADENYIQESVLHPNKHIVKG